MIFKLEIVVVITVIVLGRADSFPVIHSCTPSLWRSTCLTIRWICIQSALRTVPLFGLYWEIVQHVTSEKLCANWCWGTSWEFAAKMDQLILHCCLLLPSSAPMFNRLLTYTATANVWFLGVFAKLWRETPSSRVTLSVRMEQSGSRRTDFHEIWYLSIF